MEEAYASYLVTNEDIAGNDVYVIHVGYGAERNKLPHYLIVNRETDVVECETDNIFMALSWMKHFTEELDRVTEEEEIEGELEVRASNAADVPEVAVTATVVNLADFKPDKKPN